MRSRVSSSELQLFHNISGRLRPVFSLYSPGGILSIYAKSREAFKDPGVKSGSAGKKTDGRERAETMQI